VERFAVIVAGGTGSRMGGEVPKQFLLLRGKPILAYSLEAFHQHDSSTRIIVVLAKEELARWKSLCKAHQITVPHEIAFGGIARTDSVCNGLNRIPQEGLVAIHDGARPFVSVEMIEACFQFAETHGAAVVCIKPKDSVRQVVENENFALDRDHLRLVQTPQTFRVSLIKNAFRDFGHQPSSDDASIAELAGIQIGLVEGSYKNIKITTPEDLILAEALLAQE
jgi:2-C-methyl-D-erythritol 4-phosphate cytidylyltransferase